VLLGADAAFWAVFIFFVLAMLVLIVLTVRFVVRRDREKRAEWRSRHQSGS
jgi:membrane protein implicated in regulation of membrane protease activity